MLRFDCLLFCDVTVFLIGLMPWLEVPSQQGMCKQGIKGDLGSDVLFNFVLLITKQASLPTY